MTRSYEELLAENEELQRSLAESKEVLRAISSGEVDALVVSGVEGDQVFTLEGADRAYRVLIEAMNDGAIYMTSDGTILYCNQHFAEMVKSPLEKVLGSSICRFIPKDDQAAFRVLRQDLGRGELTLQAEDESTLPVYISVSSLQISESQKDFCVVVTDLREQKHNEEIVAAERLARSIIEQATEAILVCDGNGRIIRLSRSVSDIAGLDTFFENCDDIFDLRYITGENAGARFSPSSLVMQGQVLLRVEARFERRDGKLFYLLVNAGPLKSADGKIIGCVVSLTDITELKMAEEELQKAHDGLEMKVLERTEELAYAKEELETTNEELQLSSKSRRGSRRSS